MIWWWFAVQALDSCLVALGLLTLPRSCCWFSYGIGLALSVRLRLVRLVRETRHYGPLSSSCPCWLGDRDVETFL